MSTTIRTGLDALRTAYAASYEQLQRDLYRFLLTRLGGAAWPAQELATEALHRGWERLMSFRGTDLRPWLFRIAHNLAVDHLRDQTKHGQPLPDELPDLKRTDEPAEDTRRDLAELLRQFQEQLQTFHALLERLALLLPEPEKRQGRPARQTLLARHVKVLRQTSRVAWRFLEEELGHAQRENEP